MSNVLPCRLALKITPLVSKPQDHHYPLPIGRELIFFGDRDLIWNRVKNYDQNSFPRPNKEGLHLYATAYENRERSPSASSIPRIRIEKQEFPFSYFCFKPDSSNRLQGWQHWTDEILGNPGHVQLLKRAGVFQCIQLCRDLRIHQDQDALCTLLSR